MKMIKKFILRILLFAGLIQIVRKIFPRVDQYAANYVTGGRVPRFEQSTHAISDNHPVTQHTKLHARQHKK